MKEISLTIMLLTIGFTLANCTSDKNNTELTDSKTWMELEFGVKYDKY
jgi:hypothetical protein